MSVIREVVTGIRVTLVLWVLTALIYPLFVVLVGQVLFPYQANGSIISNAGTPVGSALIGQSFTSDKYFWSRPSTTNYSSFTPAERDPKKVEQAAGVSGASNQAPSNPDLLKRIQSEAGRLAQANMPSSADLVYTSGSSLDPHISRGAADAQAKRVAAARGLSEDRVRALIPRHTEGRFLWVFGEPGVNVLRLNLALDALQ